MASKVPQMLVSTVKRMKFEVVAEDNARVPEGAKADDLNLREVAEWYLFCNGHMLVKLWHEWVPEKVWNLVAPLAETGAPKTGYYQRAWQRTRITEALEECVPDWLSRIAPAAGGMLTRLELVPTNEVSQGQQPKYARATNTRSRFVTFKFEKTTYFADANYTDLVLKFWPSAACFTAPSLRGTGLFGEEFEYVCPLIFLLLDPESPDDGPVAGECIAAVMPMRR